MSTEVNRVDLATWRRRLSESFLPLDVDVLGRGGDFEARITGSEQGRLKARLVEVSAQPHVVRPSTTNARDAEATLMISTQLSGTCVVRQDNREAILRPTDVAIYDSGRPYELFFPLGEHRQTVLQIPVDRVDAKSLRGRTAVRIAGTDGLGRAVSPLLSAIPSTFPEICVDDREELVRSSLALLNQCLWHVNPEVPRQRSLVDEARDYIRFHLDDPMLGPAAIAAELHVSVPYLHRLFQRTGTSVRRYLIELRLSCAATDLRDLELEGRTIAEIAFSRGFKDAAHFTRTFTRKYGVTPSVWRTAPTR